MLSEAELIEIETRALRLADISSEVLAALADAITDGADYREAMDEIDAAVERCATDIARLVGLAREQRKAA